jgi:REP element-mobilizing transposase RayT
MVLNDAGRMVKRWFYETQNKFPDIVCHEMIVMPNHFHCIWENVGADLCVNPNQTRMDANLGADTQVRPYEDVKPQSGSPLSKVVQWFKTMSTNEYIRGVEQLKWPPFDRRLWQRNYYEHIIRNEFSYNDIAKYIMSNPIRWNEDQFYPLDKIPSP